MKIFICCSKSFYGKIPPLQKALQKLGHTITLPNSFNNPAKENEMREKGAKDHSKWKAKMLREQERKIRANGAILVLNFEKNGQPNYIGGATFLEMFKAFELQKKIFLYHPAPEGILKDEINGFAPTIINENLKLLG